MSKENILNKIRENLEVVIKKDSPLGESLWKELLELHPVDIADFVDDLDQESANQIFAALPKKIKEEVFSEFSIPEQAEALKYIPESDKVDLFRSLWTDELTDLFDYMSDEDLKKNIKLLHKKEREKVISLLKFHPESAGGIMDIDVLSLMEDFTVEKSVKIIQRVRPKQDIHRELYVTDDKHKLVGYINIEDLLMHSPKTRISNFIRENELVAQADEDREEIANRMVHYGQMTVPVVGKESFFLGVIPSDVLVDVIVQEATEDQQKMAALAPMKHSYFETPFLTILYKRGSILGILLLAESISSVILHSYEKSIGYLFIYITMLMSTGGNASHQTSTLVAQGIASGEIHKGTARRFLSREILTALSLAGILGMVAFLRAFFSNLRVVETTYEAATGAFAVALTLALTVLTAVILGSFIPLGLKRLGIDPAFSAGPFLATIMDIISVAIFCIIVKFVVFG